MRREQGSDPFTEEEVEEINEFRKGSKGVMEITSINPNNTVTVRYTDKRMQKLYVKLASQFGWDLSPQVDMNKVEGVSPIELMKIRFAEEVDERTDRTTAS